MTGEITLRGRVLPIGGLKSKILAAHLAGRGCVILPSKNEKDLRDIPEEIRKQIKLAPRRQFDGPGAGGWPPAPPQGRWSPSRPSRPSRKRPAQPESSSHPHAFAGPRFPKTEQPPVVV